MIPITADLVSRLVAEQFPRWAALPIRPVAKSGHDNRMFHLGDALMVRLPSDAAYTYQHCQRNRAGANAGSVAAKPAGNRCCRRSFGRAA